MNTYIVPIEEDGQLYIKKIVASNVKGAYDKLYQYFISKFPDVEGDTLDEIMDDLWEFDVDLGRIYDIDEFV